MNKPKVAYILQDFYIGGIETCLYNIALKLNQEFEFHFIATYLKDILPKFHTVGKPVYINRWGELIKYLKKEKFDLVQVHNLRQYADCAIAAGAPIIVERIAGNRAASNPKEGIDWVIASNNGTLSLIKKTCSLCQVSVIYNGVDIERINSFGANRLGFSQNDIIIGRVCRIGEGQNLGMLINAVIKINKKYPQAKLVIVGDSSRIKGAANIMLRLREMARPLGKNIVFTGEINEPFDIINGFDIATCVSNHEGIPNSLLEAMASSKAVVSTDVGQVPELINDGENGLLVLCNNTEALVLALERLIADEALRNRLGVKAKNTILENFNLEKQAQKYAQLYRVLIKDKNKRYSVTSNLRQKRIRSLLKVESRILKMISKNRDINFIRTVFPQILMQIIGLFFKRFDINYE